MKAFASISGDALRRQIKHKVRRLEGITKGVL